jgi:Domain of unknown function (DUF4160)
VRNVRGITGNKCANGFALGILSCLLYSNEGDEPAHVHVQAAGREAKFWLHDVTVAINAGFPAHEIGDIIRHLRPES